MPTTYTERLAAASVPVGQTQHIFTVPDTGRYVVRDIVIANTATVATDVSLGWRPATGAAFWLALVAALAPKTSFHLDLRQVGLPGEQLEAATSAASCSFLVTGYHLA